MRKTRKRGPGQPPTGIGGAKVSDYPRLTLRIPDDSMKLLATSSKRLGQPRWRVVHDALQAYLKGRK
jgi:hypothetical protein